jgi:hypothetical protein
MTLYVERIFFGGGAWKREQANTLGGDVTQVPLKISHRPLAWENRLQ